VWMRAPNTVPNPPNEGEVWSPKGRVGTPLPAGTPLPPTLPPPLSRMLVYLSVMVLSFSPASHRLLAATSRMRAGPLSMADRAEAEDIRRAASESVDLGGASKEGAEALEMLQVRMSSRLESMGAAVGPPPPPPMTPTRSAFSVSNATASSVSVAGGGARRTDRARTGCGTPMARRRTERARNEGAASRGELVLIQDGCWSDVPLVPGVSHQ
jgi:hypothetical protein